VVQQQLDQGGVCGFVKTVKSFSRRVKQNDLYNKTVFKNKKAWENNQSKLPKLW